MKTSENYAIQLVWSFAQFCNWGPSTIMSKCISA